MLRISISSPILIVFLTPISDEISPSQISMYLSLGRFSIPIVVITKIYTLKVKLFDLIIPFKFNDC